MEMNRYRIARHTYVNLDTDEVTYSFGVVDAYYDHSGKVTSISELPFVYPVGNTLKEFQHDVIEFLKATSFPVLDYDTLEEVWSLKDES